MTCTQEGFSTSIRQRELVRTFFDSVFSDIDSLALYAGIHPVIYGYYRMLSKRFPYAVYYKVEDDLAIVWRVLDLQSNPDRIRYALKVGRTR